MERRQLVKVYKGNRWSGECVGPKWSKAHSGFALLCFTKPHVAPALHIGIKREFIRFECKVVSATNDFQLCNRVKWRVESCTTARIRWRRVSACWSFHHVTLVSSSLLMPTHSDSANILMFSRRCQADTSSTVLQILLQYRYNVHV